jgi:hypothetical protein
VSRRCSRDEMNLSLTRYSLKPPRATNAWCFRAVKKSSLPLQGCLWQRFIGLRLSHSGTLQITESTHLLGLNSAVPSGRGEKDRRINFKTHSSGRVVGWG